MECRTSRAEWSSHLPQATGIHVSNGEDTTQERPDLAEMLVEDRELAPSDPDRFRHEDLIEQLADLAVSVDPPANVALYGPWGSGKSSIASHLKAELDQRRAPVRFARYDAFKYARLPLQRHFIRHLASTLEVTDRKYDKGLYEDSTSNDITLGSAEDGETANILGLLWQVLIVLGVALAAAVVLTAAAAFIGSWASKDDGFGDNLSAYLRAYTIGFLAPAGVLAIFGALAGKKLNVVRGVAAPTSEEQFASTFNDLVTDSLKEPHRGVDCDRVVVFIDELDRCDAGTVVATLESLRSFLDAENCIFIVAADQQVLEAALTTHVRHAIPRDSSNPYYSAGSEYLDKTFHYQLSIPPLLPRRLSGFAADLVRDKGGVWTEVGSVERVVSVLIPNHVRSPRRAKTLLNSFALHYELADRRCKVGHLAGTPAERAEEIAVLTCLRVEFPLFARELRQHPKLVDAARRLLQSENRPSTIPESTWETCQEFLEGERPIDVVLDDQTDAEGGQDPAGDSAGPTLVRAQADHLKSYLRKTGYVRAPSRDLIHLESAGARFGIDPVDADELEDAASQADFELVAEILLRLGDQRINGMLSLAESLDRDVPPLGHEADNLISVVLGLYEGSFSDDSALESGELAQIRLLFSTAVDAHTRTYDLRAKDLPGALALGIDSDTESGRRLVDTVLSHEGSVGHLQLTVMAIRYLPQLVERDDGVLAKLTARGLMESSMRAPVAAAIQGHSLELGSTLLEQVGPLLAEHLRSILTVPEAEPAQAGTKAEAESEEAGTVDSDPEAELRRAALDLLDAFLDSPQLMQRIAAVLLDVDHVEARNAVGTYLPDMVGSDTTVGYPTLSRALVAAARRRAWNTLHRWLAPVDESALDEPVRMSAADHLANGCWKAATSADDVDPERLATVLEHIRRLQTEALDHDSLLKASITESIGSPVSDAQADGEMRTLEALRVFVDAQVIEGVVAADVLLDAAVAVLASALQPTALGTGSLQRWVTEVSAQVTQHAAAEGCERLLEALAGSPWLPTPDRERIQMWASAQAQLSGHAVASPFEATEVASLLEVHGSDLDQAAAMWLRTYSPSPSAAAVIVDQLFTRRPAPEVRSELTAYVQNLDSSERPTLVNGEIRRCLEQDPRTDLLRTMEIEVADDVAVANAIASTFEDVTKMEQRRRLLDVWAEAKITDSSARLTLISKVLVPTAESGLGGMDLVIRNVTLWNDPPHGTRGSLRELRKLASADQKDKMTRALIDAGLVREERGRFGIGPKSLKDVD